MRMSARRIGVTFVIVLAAAGCSAGSGRAPYLVQSAASCPAVDALTGHRSTDPLPAGFRPVSAVRCTFQLAVDRSASSPPFGGLAWVAAQRSTGPFDGLVRALRQPPRRQDGNAVCTTVFVIPVVFALTDVSGTTLVPAVPGTRCRTPLPEVLSALDALTWVEIARRT